MSKKLDIDNFYTFIPNNNRYLIDIEKYLIPTPDIVPELLKANKEKSSLVYYDDIKPELTKPKLVTWDYLEKNDLKELINLQKKKDIYDFIGKHLPATSPKGFPRIIFRELIYNVLKFCKKHNFNLEQTGSVLSEFYWAHIYFTSLYNVSPNKLYDFFKEMQMCHSIPHSPDQIKLFNLEQTHKIMAFFCKIYLKNLPLIRFLCLPNFFLGAKYPLEPDPKFPKKTKDKKGKKGKKNKTKKK